MKEVPDPTYTTQKKVCLQQQSTMQACATKSATLLTIGTWHARPDASTCEAMKAG